MKLALLTMFILAFGTLAMSGAAIVEVADNGAPTPRTSQIILSNGVWLAPESGWQCW